MQRTWYLFSFETIHPTLVAFFQMLSILHGSALVAAPCTYPAFAWARCEVLIGLLIAHRLGSSLHADLTLVLWPEKVQRYARIALKVHRLPAVLVGVEHEASRIESTQQHHAATDGETAHRSKRHCMWLGDPILHGFLQPTAEQRDRIIACIAFRKALLTVVGPVMHMLRYAHRLCCMLRRYSNRIVP